MTSLLSCNVASKPTSAAIGTALVTMNIGIPISLLVCGILSAMHVLPFSPAASWAMIGLGSGGLIFPFPSYLIFFCLCKRKPAQQIAFTSPPHTDPTSAVPIAPLSWEQKIVAYTGKNEIIQAIGKKNPAKCPYRWVCFFETADTINDLLFGGNARLTPYEQDIMTSREKILFIIYPRDEIARQRWSREYLNSCLTGQLRDYQAGDTFTLKYGLSYDLHELNYDLLILSCKEAIQLRCARNGTDQLPSRVRKALGFYKKTLF